MKMANPTSIIASAFLALIFLGAGCGIKTTVSDLGQKNSSPVQVSPINNQQEEIDKLRAEVESLKKETLDKSEPSANVRVTTPPKVILVAPEPKSSLQDNTKTEVVIPSVIANQPAENTAPMPPALTVPDTAYCNDLQAEQSAIYKKVMQLSTATTHLLDSINQVLDAYKLGISYAHEMALSRRESFYAQADAVVKMTEESPVSSFADDKVTDMAQKFYSAAQDYKNAYDLLVEAFEQGSYGGLGIQFMNNRLDQASEKTTSAHTSEKAAIQDGIDIENSYTTLAASKKCP